MVRVRVTSGGDFSRACRRLAIQNARVASESSRGLIVLLNHSSDTSGLYLSVDLEHSPGRCNSIKIRQVTAHDSSPDPSYYFLTRVDLKCFGLP